MPPYDRRTRNRNGFNTRIAIPTLSGGVGRQAPSKRLISESQVVENALPTLEKSIEKRAGTKQLLCRKNGVLKDYGSLGLPTEAGALARITIGTPALTAASTSFTFNAQYLNGSTINLKSADATSKTYIANRFKTTGLETEAATSIKWTTVPKEPSFVTLIDTGGTSKTYVSTTTGNTGDLSGSNILFNYGALGNIVSTTYTVANLQEAIYSANGHNASAANSMKFSGPLADGSEITLTSTDGTTITYIAQAIGSGLSGTKVIFNSNIDARLQAQNLAGAINGANGHNGKITASDGGGGVINLVQAVNGVGSTSRLIMDNGFVSAVSVLPKDRFGKIHVTLQGSAILFEQCEGGAAGETAVTIAKGTDSYTETIYNFARTQEGVYVKPGNTSTLNAEALRLAILGENGHTSAKLTPVNATGTLTITQVTTGSAGNTVVTANDAFVNSTDKSFISNFAGGNNINEVFNSKTVTLTDVAGVQRTFNFSSLLLKKESKDSTVGTEDLTTSALISEGLAQVITNNEIEIAATYDSTLNEIELQMTTPGGNGTLITTNDDTLFTTTEFRSGDGNEKKFFFYWFSVSDNLRYLVVIDYSAAGIAENLFYIYLVDTVNNTVEDQTPDINTTTQDIYDYITYGNDIYDADEALEAVTIGTNIFFVNKFVKAGFSSNKEGFKFNLDGSLSEQRDYKGQEIIYHTSSVVDPDGTALLYVPNKAYVGGTEVYNQYGVWKALTDIRSESTAQFAEDDDGETVIAADPGPPNYGTSQFGSAALNAIYNVWYSFTPQSLAGGVGFTEDSVGRIRVNTTITNDTGNPLTAATAWAEGMTPSVLVDPDAADPTTAERKWLPSVENSSGITVTEGDIVYDANHSRKVKSKGSGSPAAETDEYISLWQFVREVKQIPVEDNRYVDRTKQYLGQAYSDFSNVKLPPHPTDPTDIIDLGVLGSIPDGIPNYPTNLVGEAAIAMGLLYEGKTLLYYNDIINNSGSPALTAHTDGLGKVIYVENAYADALPGYYRVQSDTVKPFLQRVRTPHPFSMFDPNRMPHRLSFTAPAANEGSVGGWAFSTVDWNLRTTGTDETNPGPKLFEEGKQSEIKALGYFRNRMWMAGEDKVFSSSLNNITNFFLEDASSITDEDPIDVTCSYNKYTEVTNLTPFENNLFVNTGSDVQFTISGSDNLISPFTAEVSPTSFYSTAPLVKPILLGSQIYFFDKKRLYIYFNDKTVSINNAVEVSYHCPDYLPEDYKTTGVVPSFDTLLFGDKTNPKNVFCYTNRYSGEQVIQNAFYKYIFDRNVESLKSYDSNVYYVTKTTDNATNVFHIQKQKFQEKDYSVPLLDNNFTGFDSVSYSPANDSTTFTINGYYNPTLNTIVVDGENITIESFTTDRTSSTVTIQGKHDTANEVHFGTTYLTKIELSPIFYRDEGQNVIDGILSLRTMHLRHHNTGNYNVEVSNRGRVTTPIKFSSKEISTRNDLMPLENNVVDGETVSKIFGFGDEVRISILSDYISPMNITNIEIKGRFNTTYSSWVR